MAPDVPRNVLLKTRAQVQLEALARFEGRDGGKVILSEPLLRVLTAPDPQPVTMAPGIRPSGTTLSDVPTAGRTVERH